MKLLRTSFLLLGLLLSANAGAWAQVFDWAKLARTTAPNSGTVLSSATDRQGNTYVAVSFTDTLRVGNQALFAVAGNAAVLRYDSTGAVVWARQLRGVTFELNNSLAIDYRYGGVYVSARAASGAAWDGNPLGTATGGIYNAFIAKCLPTGFLQWSFGRPLLWDALNSDGTPGAAFTSDGLGNFYLLGNVRRNTMYNGALLDSTAAHLTRYNSAGTPSGFYYIRTSSSPQAGSSGAGAFVLGPKPGGGCVITLERRGTLYAGGTPSQLSAVLTSPIAASQGPWGAILNIDDSSQLRWTRNAPQFGNQPSSTGNFHAVTADAAGNCYATGQLGVGTGGFGLLKYSSTGVLQWTRSQTSPRHEGPSDGSHIAADAAGNVAVVVQAQVVPSDSAVVLDGQRLTRLDNIVRYNTQGQLQWTTGETFGGFRQVGSTFIPAPFLSAGGVGVDGRGNIYYAATVAAEPTNRRPALLLGAYTTVGYGAALARIGTRHNLLTGAVYLDLNGNGRRDAGEGPYPQPTVLEITQTGRTSQQTTDSNTAFTIYADSGAYQLQLPRVPAHYTLTQPAAPGYAGRFVGYGRTDSLKFFGLHPVTGQADLRVLLTPYSNTRPGFTNRYRVTVENVGTTPVMGTTVTLTLDSRLLYISSTPAGSRSGQTISWTLGNTVTTGLAPFARRDFDVLFSLPLNVALGTTLSSTATATLSGDVNPADNTETLSQTVAGSLDPNDLTVSLTRLTLQQVRAGQLLDYTVRFQNIGTDTAFAVVLTDTLDSQRLKMSTLNLVSQSHNCQWMFSPNGSVVIRFINIKLPERSADVIRSQGFVRFQVQPKSTLIVGDIIPNHARIFFDFNSGVLTNLVTTIVMAPAAVLNNHSALAWDGYPNPASGLFNITADLPSAGTVTFQLLDALGRPVQQHTLAAPAGALRQVLDLSPLAPGLYVLRLHLPDGTVSTRQVVRE